MTSLSQSSSAQPSPSARARVSFRLKLVLVILGVSAVVAATGSLGFMSLMRSATRSVIGVSLGTAAIMIAGDVNERDVMDAAAGDGRARASLEAMLASARQRFRSEIRPLSVEGVDLDAVLDSWYIASLDREKGECVVLARVGRIELGTRFELPQMDSGPQKVRSDATQGVVFEEEATHKGDRGMVLSSFAPVRNAEGRPVAMVGLDTAGTYFEVPDRSVWTFGLGTFAVSVLIGLPAALLLAGRLSHPVGMLRTGMQRLAEGELDTQLPVRRRGDEFDDLMRQFNATAAGLREREEMRRSLETASEVQQHLLPQRTCEIPGYELCTAVRYCDETGGDYADCFPLEDAGAAEERRAERWGVAVGDVTGHGVASALLMAWTRAMVRATAPMHADDVSAMMRLVNRHLLRDSNSGTFLTLFFGTLHAEAHTLAWVSAGHEPAVVVRAASGVLELLGATDVPLGIEASAPMPCGAVVRLEPGDVVVIGTDGVTQARSPTGDFFGSERIAEVVRAEMAAGGKDGASVTRLREALFAAVAAHRCGAAQDDDETFVVVKRRR